MGLRRSLLVLYILLIFHLFQHNFPTVTSRPSSSVGTNHETLPYDDLKQDVVGFEGKAREIAFVIKKGLGGFFGRGRKGGSRKGGKEGEKGGDRRGGGGQIPGSGGGGQIPGQGGGGLIPGHGGGGVIPGNGGGGVIPGHGIPGRSHRSSGSRNLQGAMYVVGWLVFSVLAGLFLG